MPQRERVERAAEEGRRLARHAESVAKEMSKGPMAHFMNASMEMLTAANAAMRTMDIPEETRQKMHGAMKEFMVGMKGAIDVFIAELDKENSERHELHKIEIKKRPAK